MARVAEEEELTPGAVPTAASNWAALEFVRAFATLELIPSAFFPISSSYDGS